MIQPEQRSLNSFMQVGLVGFTMLGSRWNHEVLTRWILEKRAPDDVVLHLAEASFDVEFGALDLREMQRSDIALTREPAP